MTTPATALNDALAYLLARPAGDQHTMPISCTKSQPDLAAWCDEHGLEIVKQDKKEVTLRMKEPPACAPASSG